MAKLGVPADRLEWTREHATLIETWPAAVATRPAPRAGGRGGQLVITGMHRSATSLVANLMQQAGLEIGDQLMGPGPGNRRGHFEDRDFYVLHEQMLAAIDRAAWFAPQYSLAAGEASPVEAKTRWSRAPL